MRIFRHFSQANDHPLALSIGNFDGMHRGHQALLRLLIETARKRGLKSAVMTFEPHPREFFAPDQAPPRLSSLREKLELFAEAGVEYVYTCHFNRRFAQMTAESFMHDVLRRDLRVEAVLVGRDFRFGAGRQGTFGDFATAGFELVSLRDVECDGQRISSTAVRAALMAGDLGKAAQLLGRPYSMSGKVVRGDQLGRTLGYPTANIHMLHRRPPLYGVYAVELEGVAASRIPGVASFGVRPTVKQNGRPLLEVHLFDFQQDIYGRHVRVHLLHKIRDEMKFSDLETLKNWIASDAQQARQYLKLAT